MRYMMGLEPLALVFKLLFMTVRTHFGELWALGSSSVLIQVVYLNRINTVFGKDVMKYLIFTDFHV